MNGNTKKQPAEAGILVIHGIGKQGTGFSDSFQQAVNEHLGASANVITWQEGYWADELNGRESDMLAALRKQGGLDWFRLREMVIAYFADAIAYRRAPVTAGGKTANTYTAIHDKIDSAIAALRQRLVAPDSPLIVVAHSLGSVIFSDHVWDCAKATEGDPFVNMRSLSGIITFGSNLPLFTLALPKIEPIAFPPVGLSASLAEKARWLNFFDPDDVLGYPLEPFYGNLGGKLIDRTINADGLFTSWSPMSHTEYWDDDGVISETAKLISDILSATSTNTTT